jgi:hypothetical protein
VVRAGARLVVSCEGEPVPTRLRRQEILFETAPGARYLLQPEEAA